MKISELLQQVKVSDVLHCERDIEIGNISCFPAKVNSESLHCCIDEFLVYGYWQLGKAFLPEVIEKKPKALLLAEPLPDISIAQLISADPRKTMAHLARQLMGCPDNYLKLVGVTGTNGKTTTTHLIRHVLNVCGVRAASHGTLGTFIGDQQLDGPLFTTPLSPDLFEKMHQAREAGADAFITEVSSHALALDRVEAVPFDCAVFTNLTHDHLDFHGSIEAYAAAKARLFTHLRNSNSTAAVNMDDPAWQSMLSDCRGRVLTYGVKNPTAEVRVIQIQASAQSLEFTLVHDGKSYPVYSPLVGAFQVSNILAALCACYSLGISWEQITKAVSSFERVSGRMEKWQLPSGVSVIVDFAHTPDALKNVLQAARGLNPNRLITVFGCGGDRDRTKRPIMGAIAESMSDYCFLTSDNPRFEKPDAILEDIKLGMELNRHRLISDRETAIREACSLAQLGDIVLIAGKGHEPYQEICGERIVYSDQAVLADIIRKGNIA
jgi:UDP-N-acetylmuramyl-tripeptide synthetase